MKVLKVLGHAQITEIGACYHPHPSLWCLWLFQTLVRLSFTVGNVQPVETEALQLALI